MDARLATTNQLLLLAREAQKFNYNRQLDIDALSKDVDPNGVHVFSILLPYHHASFGPTVEPIWPEHHRCSVLIKVNGTMEPVTVMLDVSASQWDKLWTTEEWDEFLNGNATAKIDLITRHNMVKA